MQPKVSTVVLNWNGWRDTAVCLSSLRQLTYANHRVIVVDNGSTDGSVARLRQQFPWAMILETGTNLGFAGGCNFGIRHSLSAGADFIWLLNNDAIVAAESLTALVHKAASDERIAAVGSPIYFMQNQAQLQAWGGGRVNFCLGRSRHYLRPTPDAHIDYLTGASLLLRSQALHEVGLLDEGFFFYWEDADLSFRLRRAHWKLAVAPDAKIWHKQSSSLHGQNVVLDTYFNQAACRFFRKHASVPAIPIYTGLILRFLKRALTGQFQRARAVWHVIMQAPHYDTELQSQDSKRGPYLPQPDWQRRNAE